MQNIKILKSIYKAYKRGFIYTVFYCFWLFKFFLFNFFRFSEVRTRYNIKCVANFEDRTFRFYFLGSYGFFYSNYLKDYSSKFVFIDIGANKGLYSVIAAKNNNCDKVISFEPVLKNFGDLQKNCLLNNILSKCELYNFAISKICENKKIYFNKNHSGSASLVLNHKKEDASLISIKTINNNKLNKLIPDQSKNYIVKIDVEGLELIVLQELFKCDFAKYISSIFYEADERWVNTSLIKKLLLDNGFKKFNKIGQGVHYDIMVTK